MRPDRLEKAAAIDENLDAPAAKEKLTPAGIVNNIFGYLSGCLTPMIPVLIAASLCKTVVAIFGPQLLGIVPEDSDFLRLFTTFPLLGFDGFMIPGMIAGSWAGTGVALACVLKFKKPENKSMVISYLLTWFFGGVGEPMLYGLNLRYRTSLYASIISGAITGFVTGLVELKAYVLTTSNGMYGLLAFMGGPKWNYVALVIMLAVGLISGFVTMMFFPLKEED